MGMYRPEVGAGVADVDLDGRTVLLTGATDGVGREAALALGRLGATVLVHGRDPEKGSAVVDELRETEGDGAFYRGEFTQLGDVDALADAVLADHDLDVLVNNAGAYFDDGALTELGVERTFQVNHLAPFRLTERLRSAVDRPGGRVVTVASEAHRGVALDLSRVRSVADYDALTAYRHSKLANVLFTRELARRLDHATANCLHPGFVPGSGLWRNSSLPMRALMGLLTRLPGPLSGEFVASEADAAETTVYLVASDTVSNTTGQYFSDCAVAEPSRPARDDEAAARLWAFSADLLADR